MKEYKARLSAPAANNKNYIRYDKGGYNYCIHIGNGSCLPNCVGYAWGRWREILGAKPNLSRANAENWFGYTADGYKRGQTPKLGAVVCWRKGKAGVEADGAGHVGIVEKITLDSVVVSMSAYGGTRWFTRTFKKDYYSYNSFVFQGFIYLPIDFDEEAGKKSVTEVAKEVIAGKWGNGETRKAKLEAAGYDYKQVQSKVNALISAAGKKSVTEVAKEVIAGKWGNGETRKAKLEAAGYDYAEVQNMVNVLLR